MARLVIMAGFIGCVALTLALNVASAHEIFSPIPGITYSIFDAV